MKVIVLIHGGLGNQLFCYAAGRALALRNSCELVLDTVSGFASDPYKRCYGLGLFAVAGREATSREQLPPPRSTRRRVMQLSNLCLPYNKRHYIRQLGSTYDPRLCSLKLSHDVYLHGYWQSEDYFKSYASIIRGDLRPINSVDHTTTSLAQKIQHTCSVALHVRFFEDFSIPSHLRLGTDYYARAIRAIQERLDGAHFYIFSDDPERAASEVQMHSVPSTVIPKPRFQDSAFRDLSLMRQCKHFITADSTFSWWGAWLGEYSAKVVITPALSRQVGISFWGFQKLIPSDWIQL